MSTDFGAETSPELERAGSNIVLHWYDFLCPFCYVAQQRNDILKASGIEITNLPFEAHPEIPKTGLAVPVRVGSMYEFIEAEARDAGLPLVWPTRLPNTRLALAAAEWVRQQAPDSFTAFKKSLFAAHFSMGQDLGNKSTIIRHGVASGIDSKALDARLSDGSALALVTESENLARSVGVHGTPAWLMACDLISGLKPKEFFEQWIHQSG